MLNLLVKYAEEHNLEAEPGFKAKEVRWLIVIDEGGSLIEVIELGKVGETKYRGKQFDKCPDLSQSEMISGGVTRSHFLVETAEIATLFSDKKVSTGENDTDGKKIKKFNYFRELFLQSASVMPQMSVVAKSLGNKNCLQQIHARFETLKAKPTDKVTFRVGSIVLLDSENWHEWWRDFRKKLISGKPDKAKTRRTKSINKNGDSNVVDQMRCLATGSLVKPVKTHPKIEHLSDVGGISSGDVLIGFDKESFCSYGLSQSENAAIGEQAVASYRTALNHLIKTTGQRVAGTKVVHWFKKRLPVDDDPLNFLTDPPEIEEMSASESLNRLLKSVKEGTRTDFLRNHYYAMILSGASGRIMLRDWIEGDFEELVTNISNWFADLSITNKDGSGLARDPKFIDVLKATVRELKDPKQSQNDSIVSKISKKATVIELKDLKPSMIKKMWRAAVCDEPISYNAMFQAITRVKIDIMEDKGFNHARMGLLKAFNLRKNRSGGQVCMQNELGPTLNENHSDVAYQCGRLLAMMAQLQRSALGDVGAGVVQRYYAAASSTPALVLGRLARNSQFHLNKLDAGLAFWYETKIAEIWSRIHDNIPKTLSLESQSVFALGYYQQIASLRSGKSSVLNENQGVGNEQNN